MWVLMAEKWLHRCLFKTGNEAPGLKPSGIPSSGKQVAAPRPGAGSLLLGPQWGRGTQDLVSGREGPSQGCGPPRAVGWHPSRFYLLRGPGPSVAAPLVAVPRPLSGEGVWQVPTCPPGPGGQTVALGSADPCFFPGRSWRGSSRGVSAWLHPAGGAWTPPSSASMCFAGRSGDHSPPPLPSE